MGFFFKYQPRQPNMQQDIQTLHQAILQGAQISIDSRQISPNTIFFALKGEKADGNDFALEALQKGALLAVADKPSLPADQPRLIKVKNCLQTLQQLARFHRNTFNIPVLAITGSNGKTTTKELVSTVLAQKYHTHFTQGNYNNHIGVPLTLLRMNTQHQMAVIEMGANHMGEIDLLCQIADPDHGLITNTGKAHIEGFGSVENIVKGKTELYRYLIQRKGSIFVNADNSTLMEHLRGFPNVFSFGKQPGHQVWGKIVSAEPFLVVEATIPADGNSETQTIPTQLIGGYNFENVMMAVCVGSHFGVSLPEIALAIGSYTPQNSRSQFTDTGTNKVIWDAYNANPTSMSLAIENFAAMSDSPKALILGDMLEMGSTALQEHQYIADLVQAKGFQLCLLVGQEFEVLQSLPGHIHQFPCTETAARWLKKNPLKGYTILVKGSRGIALEKLKPLL